jgi:G3E family GTPase
MENIITVVGFLGAGKTTLIKHLVSGYLNRGWSPYVILNDYENAHLDAQQIANQGDPKSVIPLNGSCICCSGISELRYFVNRIPKRDKGITLIEANGTSDACSLMGFLSVGLNERFLPPVQVSIVDVKNWQRRGEYNELEANQIQVSSLVVLNHTENTSEDRQITIAQEIRKLNSKAEIITYDNVNAFLISKLSPSGNKPDAFNHLKAHWSSCSIDLTNLPNEDSIRNICEQIPKSILRVKGCTRIGKEEKYTFFERTPDGHVRIRPFNGVPTTGSKLLAVGPGSDPSFLDQIVKSTISLESRTAKLD